MLFTMKSLRLNVFMNIFDGGLVFHEPVGRLTETNNRDC